MGVAINQFAVREMVGLSYGATSLFTMCSVLEIWWLKLQLKLCSEMGVPVLRPPEMTFSTQSYAIYWDRQLTGLRWNERGTNGDLNDDDWLKQMASNIGTNPALPILSLQRFLWGLYHK